MNALESVQIVDITRQNPEYNIKKNAILTIQGQL